ncbi:MAG: TrkH family potassium uptake protein [Clostridia bacterium]|nr:TrkH family potassium uptake protein [Clostridia bacterium]
MTNKRMIAYILGILLWLEAAVMLLPCIIGLIYMKADTLSPVGSFIISISILLACGGILLTFKPKDKTIYSRDGFVIVSLGWIAFSLFGALPFTFSGAIPNYLDAVFEAVSGFTTTGASILTDVECLPHSILFWRSFTHWIGGMGVLVFLMAILPLAGGGGDLYLMKAESPGPDVGKLVPRSKNTARILYSLYFGLTLIEFMLLLFGDMDWFAAITHTFGTAGTGGFGIKNDSIASYSSYSQIVITVFMILFGVNFNVFFLLICKKVKEALKSEELRVYLGIIFVSIVLIAINISSIYPDWSFFQIVNKSSFQVASYITTTGFTTTAANDFPNFSRMILLILMCVGACAGSTGGGFKIARIILIFKNAKREIKRLIHPRSVNAITFDGKNVDTDVRHGTNVFFVIYAIITALSFLIVSIDDVDLLSAVSGVVSALNNIGPGFGRLGIECHFAFFSPLSKIIFIFDMLFGRLEIYPMLILFAPLIVGKNGRTFRRRIK